MATNTQEYIFRSKLPDIELENHLPLTEYLFQRHQGKASSRPCLIDAEAGRVLSYGDVDLLARRVGAGLSCLGIRKGDVVMLLLPNCIEFVLAFLGAARIGATVTTANPLCTASEIEKQASGSGARMIVTHAAQIDKLDRLLHQEDREREICVMLVSDGFDPIKAVAKSADRSNVMFFASALLQADESECPEVEIAADVDVVTLPFSSGTTSLPKGVELTHKNLITCIAQLVDGENPNLFLHGNDRMLCVLPLFHIYCLSCVLFASLRAGAAIVVMRKYEIGAMLGAIQRFQVTAACLVPPILLALAKNPVVGDYDLSSLRFIMSGAAPLGKELERAIGDKLPGAIIAQGYGMTEAGPLISMSLAFAKTPFAIKSGSCGTIVRNTEAKIVDTETGESLAYGVCGEICLRGPQIMKGYLRNVEATMATIDKEGWLHTGDVGFIDRNEELFIVDRVKELIKFKGFQVAPAEIEALLVSHPRICDAAVVGKSDEVAGELPVAFVVRSPGILRVSEDDVKQFIAKQVVFYKRLHSVIFVDSIPKSAAGKILRKVLKSALSTN
ncbi:4-coumarate--CoA ligase 1-like [Selaginella moellendorffii]|uniref:4-coumarate--CoA ligase 1-like n=1 Tax=Selaginella moellendorffii TaxID=88036 RepID=UPI000D1C43FC|nr:4-coumarate--CoA ligase 1-like [Selaginella moellendorffii]|eukprot:XP_024545356.1 4-coumarate--CoA ligase 1-like [Selaginella moellendorffii]